MVAIDQTPSVTEQSTFTVAMQLSSSTNVQLVYFTFCQITSPVCYSPVRMTAQGSNWFSGTTLPMSSYPGMRPGAVAGYNITIEYTDNSTFSEPALPNVFGNLTVVDSVSGQYEYRMSVEPLVFALSGVVTDGASGAPVVGAVVAMSPGTNSTVTSAMGMYDFPGLTNGTYRLLVTASGYDLQNATVDVSGQNATHDFALVNATRSTGPPGGSGPSIGLGSIWNGPARYAVVAIVVSAVALLAVSVAYRRGWGIPSGPEVSRSERRRSSSSRPLSSRFRRGVPIALVAILLVATVYVALPFVSARSGSGSTTMAPDFTLTDIYGHPFALASYRNSAVVLIEFTALSCSECKIVERTIASLYAGYNATGTTKVQVISVFIEPQFGDSIPALQARHLQDNITWRMAQDTPNLAVAGAYHVVDMPDVFIVDEKGQIVYDQSGAQSSDQLQATIGAALRGTAPAIALVTLSVFAIAGIAGLTTFFSPCAFPMFPGYMGLYLGLNAPAPVASARAPGSYSGAARRAALAGSATALGMLVVFLALGVALILAASAISKYVPDLQAVVGVVLIGLGALLLTNLQYWRIIAPVQRLGAWIRGKGAATADAPPPSPGEGLYLKLFGYGVGYAAAAAGCVAPAIFSAIFAGLALGLVGGLLTVVIYSLTAAILMIVVTVLLAVASRRFVNRLKAATPLIKKVSAAALIVVGAYLLYFYYTAWIA